MTNPLYDSIAQALRIGTFNAILESVKVKDGCSNDELTERIADIVTEVGTAIYHHDNSFDLIEFEKAVFNY